MQSRLYMLVKILNREVQLADIKQSIQMRTREDIDRQQREYFLQQQIKNIQDELGAGQEDEIDELRQKGKTKKWSPEMAELFEKEVSKLERTNSQSPDFNVLGRPMVTGITTDGNITMLRKGITGISLLNSIAVTSSGSVWISANIEMSSLSVFNKISSFLFLFIIYSSCVKLSPMPKTGTKLIIPCRIRKIHGN